MFLIIIQFLSLSDSPKVARDLSKQSALILHMGLCVDQDFSKLTRDSEVSTTQCCRLVSFDERIPES